MTQMVYDERKCGNEFIKSAMVTVARLNNISFRNYNIDLAKVKNQEESAARLKVYLEYFGALDLKAYFMNNAVIRPAVNFFYIRNNIKTMSEMIEELMHQRIAGGYLNRETIRRHIPREVVEGYNICITGHINLFINDDIKLPSCNRTAWTTDNIKTKDIRVAITNISTITYDLAYLRDKFGFSNADMAQVPQNPYSYLRQVVKDTGFRAFQYKLLNKLIYTRKQLKIFRIVDSDICERCEEEVEDFKHLIWSCSYSVNIWKEVERYIRKNLNVILELKYHNIIMGVNPEEYQNHEAINTIIMVIAKRICYMERLKQYDENAISNIIEGRIKVEKCVEKKKGIRVSKWDVRV